MDCGGALPTGKSEKGDWSLNGNAGLDVSSVSFIIPLVEAPVAHYIRVTGLEPIENNGKEEEVSQPACPGSAEEPKAEPGNLCVYGSDEAGVVKASGEIYPRICSLAVSGGKSLEGCLFLQHAGADATGFGLLAAVEGTGLIGGSWAVTAE